jgi:hypothetical protein
VGDAAKAPRSKIKDLIVPIVRAQRLPVTENDRLSLADIFVEDIRPVVCLDKTHEDSPFADLNCLG